MLDQGSTSHAAVTVDNINDTGREASLLDQGSQVENAEGSLLSSLHDDSVTAGERRSELPGGHGQRKIPGDNLAYDADGLAQSIGELLGGGANGLTHNLIGPASVVAEDVGDLAEIIVERDLVRLAYIRLRQSQSQRSFFMHQWH